MKIDRNLCQDALAHYLAKGKKIKLLPPQSEPPRWGVLQQHPGPGERMPTSEEEDFESEEVQSKPFSAVSKPVHQLSS